MKNVFDKLADKFKPVKPFESDLEQELEVKFDDESWRLIGIKMSEHPEQDIRPYARLVYENQLIREGKCKKSEPVISKFEIDEICQPRDITDLSLDSNEDCQTPVNTAPVPVLKKLGKCQEFMNEFVNNKLNQYEYAYDVWKQNPQLERQIQTKYQQEAMPEFVRWHGPPDTKRVFATSFWNFRMMLAVMDKIKNNEGMAVLYFEEIYRKYLSWGQKNRSTRPEYPDWAAIQGRKSIIIMNGKWHKNEDFWATFIEWFNEQIGYQKTKVCFVMSPGYVTAIGSNDPKVEVVSIMRGIPIFKSGKELYGKDIPENLKNDLVMSEECEERFGVRVRHLPFFRIERNIPDEYEHLKNDYEIRRTRLGDKQLKVWVANEKHFATLGLDFSYEDLGNKMKSTTIPVVDFGSKEIK